MQRRYDKGAKNKKRSPNSKCLEHLNASLRDNKVSRNPQRKKSVKNAGIGKVGKAGKADKKKKAVKSPKKVRTPRKMPKTIRLAKGRRGPGDQERAPEYLFNRTPLPPGQKRRDRNAEWLVQRSQADIEES